MVESTTPLLPEPTIFDQREKKEGLLIKITPYRQWFDVFVLP
jgi:hypothetical protein